MLKERIRLEQWQANGDRQQATALHNSHTPMPTELNISDRAIFGMFHAVKPPDLLNCASDFNPDYRRPRIYVDGRLKLGKPQFHTADEVTEDMSKELIVGKKAEDELTQLLDAFCGGGLAVYHVDVPW